MITKFVIAYRAAETAAKKSGNTEPICSFEILGKSFSAKIGDLLARIQHKDGHRHFHDGGKRHHRTDGIIMTPDEPYGVKTCRRLFKWKFTDLQSVGMSSLFILFHFVQQWIYSQMPIVSFVLANCYQILGQRRQAIPIRIE